VALLLTLLPTVLLAVLVFPDVSWLPFALGAALVALEIGGFVWWWVRWRRSSNGVVATDEGIRWLRPRKADVFVPWDEARLFEVWREQMSGAELSGYALMSTRALVDWCEYAPNTAPAAADGATYEEMLRRSHAIVQTVIARTGLTPRTCEPALAAKEETGAALDTGSDEQGSGWRRLSLMGVALILALAAIPLVAAVGAVVAPLSTSRPLNICVAVTMGAAGLTVLVFDVWTIVGIVRVRAPSYMPQPDTRLPAPPPDAGQLSLRTRHLVRDRMLALGIGLLTLGDIYALIRGYIDFFDAFDRSIPWWNLHQVTQVALTLTVLVLSVVAIAAILDKGTHIVADEQGVRSTRGRKTDALPWDMIAELVIQIEKGKIESYKAVAGDALRTEVGWPADALWAGAAPTMPAGSPAVVFAAAVAQRAEVTPTVEHAEASRSRNGQGES
jgi:hypothetical protein